MTDNSVEPSDKSTPQTKPTRRKQDDPLYQRASDIAAKAMVARDKRKPFRDEDESLEYERTLRSDTHWQLQTERYGSNSCYRFL